MHDLQVGLSLLVNFNEIVDPLDWQVGKHGVEISFKKYNRNYSATFLPEVAHEEGWDQIQTLEELVEKAGYPNGLEYVIEHMKVKTYESLKVKLTYH